MTTHSSVLTWEIPWTEEPDGLQSTGLRSWILLSTTISISKLCNSTHLSLLIRKMGLT